MDDRIKDAIDKLFEEARQGDKKAGDILNEIFTKTLFESIKSKTHYPMPWERRRKNI